MNLELEICVDSIQSAINAQQGGADRIELCDNLDQGGITPSAGKIVLAKQKLNIPVFVLVRPRKGDFLYSDIEFETLLENIKLAKSLGADGIVSGTLTNGGEINLDRTRQMVEACRPLPFTFHRAFDMCKEPFTALDQLIDLGIERILTSGLEANALDGKEMIRRLVEKAGNHIRIMAGAGIRPENIAEILEIPGLTSFHSSARSWVTSQMEFKGNANMGSEALDQEFKWQEVDVEKVSALKRAMLSA